MALADDMATTPWSELPRAYPATAGSNGLRAEGSLMHAIYERITVPGPEIVGVRLTWTAYAHGLALGLPEKVRNGAPGTCRARDSNRQPADRGPR